MKLNYNVELSDQIGRVMGPNMFGERLEVVSQETSNGRTTLTLRIFREQ